MNNFDSIPNEILELILSVCGNPKYFLVCVRFASIHKTIQKRFITYNVIELIRTNSPYAYYNFYINHYERAILESTRMGNLILTKFYLKRAFKDLSDRQILFNRFLYNKALTVAVKEQRQDLIHFFIEQGGDIIGALPQCESAEILNIL